MLDIDNGVIIFRNVTIDSVTNYDTLFEFDHTTIYWDETTLSNIGTYSGIKRAKFTDSIIYHNTKFHNIYRLEETDSMTNEEKQLIY